MHTPELHTPESRVANILVDARKSRGKLLKDIAAKMNVSPSVVANWENEDILPSLSKAMSIIEAYEIENKDNFILVLKDGHEENKRLKDVRRSLGRRNTRPSPMFFNGGRCPPGSKMNRPD